jgi:hypothetical protein
MDDQLFIQPCPDCNRPVEFKFGLLMSSHVAVLFFGKCEWCHVRGDPRSNRFIAPIEEDDYRQAFMDGLFIIKTVTGDDDDEDDDEDDED